MTASSADFPLDPPIPFTVAAAGAPVERGAAEVFELRWIAEAQNGCHEAFRLLVERHQESVYRFCHHWLRCPEDATEACQDTFLRAWQALPRFRPKAKFSTWLFRIALNLCRDRARSREARNRSLTDAFTSEGPVGRTQDEWPCPLPQPDEAATIEEDLKKLRKGLASLPQRHREVLILAVMEGFSHQECGDILGCSVRAVESRLFRARRDLTAWWESRPI